MTDARNRPAKQYERILPAFILAVAAWLRIWHLGHGLPDFVEEAIPFKQALEMWTATGGGIDWNPHFFNYPSLSIYLHFLLQQAHFLAGRLTGAFASSADYHLAHAIDPTVHVLVARSLGVACDLVSIFLVWRLGERLRRGAGLWAAALLAVSVTAVSTSRLIFTDSLMTMFAVAALERMAACARDGGLRRFLTAAAMMGLAAGAKYTAGWLALPLAWTAWRRRGFSCWRWWLAGAGVAVAVFCATSPYVLIDFSSFWANFTHERSHMAEGHLGVIDRTGAGFLFTTLGRDLGWAGLAALAAAGASGISALLRRRPADTRTVLWLFLLPMGFSMALFRMEAARYLVPLLPPAALLIGDLLARGAASGRPRTRTAAIAVGALALIQSGAAGFGAARSGSDTTQLMARHWIQANVRADELVLQESYGVHLMTPSRRSSIAASDLYRAASEPMRRRFDAIPARHLTTIPLLVSGSYRIRLEDGRGRVEEFTPFAHGSDVSAAFYDPRLLDGVDYVLTSGAVRERFAANPGRYPAQGRFYALLDDAAAVAARFRPGGAVDGPAIVIYRLDDRFRKNLRSTFGELGPYWWTAPVPEAFRGEMARRLDSPPTAQPGSPGGPDGEPAPWVHTLDRIFLRRVRPFALELSMSLLENGRPSPARNLAVSLLMMQPDLVTASLIEARAAARLDLWAESLPLLERSLRSLPGNSESALRLRLEKARCLAMTGDIAGARAECAALAKSGGPVAGTAARMLADLGG